MFRDQLKKSFDDLKLQLVLLNSMAEQHYLLNLIFEYKLFKILVSIILYAVVSIILLPM